MTNCLYPLLLCLCAGPITAASFLQFDPKQVNGATRRPRGQDQVVKIKCRMLIKIIKTAAQCIKQRSSKPKSP